jgi:hypothetical protein
MRRARWSTAGLGEAVSIESALTVMVVIIILRFLFLIPLVNIDRARLDEAQRDVYWKNLTEWLAARPADTAAKPYCQTFGLEKDIAHVSDAGAKRYIEALSPEGEITVIMHDLLKKVYVSLNVKGHSSVVTYRSGDLRWSAAEHEWFTANNAIDYGEKDASVAMQKAYREWTQKTRGF